MRAWAFKYAFDRSMHLYWVLTPHIISIYHILNIKFAFVGVQQQANEARQTQSRKAIIRMLGKTWLQPLLIKNNRIFVYFNRSCCCDNILRVLGAIPRATTYVFACPRLALLPNGQHMALLRGRTVLLFLVVSINIHMAHVSSLDIAHGLNSIQTAPSIQYCTTSCRIDIVSHSVKRCVAANVAISSTMACRVTHSTVLERRWCPHRVRMMLAKRWVSLKNTAPNGTIQM